MAAVNTLTPAPLLDSTAAIEAFEQTPLSERFPAVSGYDMIQQCAAEFGDDPALEFLLHGQRDEPAQTTSFRQLAAATNQLANLLYSLGNSPLDAVSILLPVLPQSHPAILGAQAAGLANPINPMLDSQHIAEIIKAADAKIIICLAPSRHADLWEKLQQVLPLTPQVHTVLAVHQSGLTDPDLPCTAPGTVTVLDYNAETAQQPADCLLSGRKFKPEELAAYFHTGGTTGRPKLACLTHGNMAFIAQLLRAATAHLERQTVLCGLPLFHIFGVIIQGVAAFSSGYRVVLLTPSGFRSPDGIKHFWHHIARFRVNSFAAVPTVLTMLEHVPAEGEDISSLSRINSGAAPLSPAFQQRFEKKYRLDVTNGYGMTETTSLIARPPEQQPPGSVGLRLPYSQIRIAELDGVKVTRDCRPREAGVILVKGPQVFAGYKSETDNAQAWVEDGWFNTGDLGYLDDDGFLYLTGRAKDLIIRSGHNIDPEIIEEVLHQHPAVASAIAIGMPDPHTGEMPMAYVVLQPDAECSASELLKFCQLHVPERAAVPKRIEFIDAMPLTAVGKIFRPALRERITQTLVEETLEAEELKGQVHATIDRSKDMLVKVALDDPRQEEQLTELLDAFNLNLEISVPPDGDSALLRGDRESGTGRAQH